MFGLNRLAPKEPEKHFVQESLVQPLKGHQTVGKAELDVPTVDASSHCSPNPRRKTPSEDQLCNPSALHLPLREFSSCFTPHPMHPPPPPPQGPRHCE